MIRTKMKTVAILLGLATSVIAKSQVLPQHHCESSGHDDLTCYLRTLQSDIDATDKQISGVKKLKVVCSDVFFFESELKSEHFGSLPNLEELSIDFCKIRHLPARSFAGLNNLKRLSVQSHNSEWTSILMDIDVNTFQKLDQLQDLNLAHNNLWSVPINTLCGLPNLKSLNVSNNHLLELIDLGVSYEDGCISKSLTELDLSNNHIASLRADDLRQIPNIVKLDLRGNRLKLMEDNSLRGMSNLRDIDLSNNQLAALPPTLFKFSQHKIEKILLQNNSLTALASSLFSGLKNLSVLNLSHNSVVSSVLPSLSDLVSLKILDLSFNQLSDISSSTFEALTSLQVLNLKGNSLKVIPGGAFAFQNSLKILTLSRNQIAELDRDAFVGLTSLTSLSLDHNNLQHLLDDQLRDSRHLEDLSFNSNRLRSVPKAARSLAKLRTLDLGENKIVRLESGDFKSLKELYGLRLAGNELTSLNREHFANATGLHVLNIAHNNLRSIEQGSFDGLQELRALRLDNNRLKDINGIVSSLPKLQWFNVSSNRLQWFDYAFIPTSLEWLDIHDNEIEELGNYFTLRSGFSLKTIDASSNLIKSLTKLSLPSSLEQVILNKNAIRKISDGVFEDKPKLIRVELMSNEINHLKMATLSVGKSSPSQGRPEFYLGGNPFLCDCELDWLAKVNSHEDDPSDPAQEDLTSVGHFGLTEAGHRGSLDHQPLVADLDTVMCRLNNQPTNDTLVPIKQVRQDQFLCQYQTHCFSLCMCCEFYACDCRMQCPDDCACYHDSAWSTNIIQCGVRTPKTNADEPRTVLNDVPLLIPMDATSVYLDGNELGHVDTQSFIGRRRITSLYMNSSHVKSVSKESFSGLNSLTSLHLEDNSIKELHGHEFSDLPSLRELYLQNNDLVSIASETFKPLRSLAVLRLDGNLLTSTPMWELINPTSKLVALFLAENMWTCDCQFVQPFKNFLQMSRDRIPDKSGIQCITEDFVKKSLVSSTDGQLSTPVCGRQPSPRTDVTDLTTDGAGSFLLKKEMIPVLISAVCVALVLFIGFLAVCVYKAKIKNWLYNKSSEIYESRSSSSSIVSASENTNSATIHNNKLFDVYVSYSIRDAEFVDHSLAPTLEHGPTAYRLCLHQRDFPPSASIYDTVSVASESSSKILLVLSKSYIEHEWPQVKLPLRNTTVTSGKMVILMLEDIPKDMVDSELQKYLKSCAVVKWGSSGYLNKLRFFLPEPAFLTFQRSVTLRTQIAHQSPMVCSTGGSSSSTASSIAACKLSFQQQAQQQQLAQQQQQQLPLSDQSAWAYTVESNPIDSVQNPDAARLYQLHRQLRANQMQMQQMQPGSIYSHHTYQSIPEGHIYHTLEPENGKSVYINKNLELILKAGGGPGNPSNGDRDKRVEPEAIAEDDEEVEEEEDQGDDEKGVEEEVQAINQGRQMSPRAPPVPEHAPSSNSSDKVAPSSDHVRKQDSCHHSHSKSTLSEQQLIPSSADCSTDEYIV